MLPLHTQKTLDQLTWREVQLLHRSLGLKATKATATRRDYQRRIVESQPQPIAEPEQKATALTCATCPLARHIDGDRYECGLTDTVTRGYWEARINDCYDAVAAKTEIKAAEIVVEIEAPIVFQEIATESPIAQETAATTTDDTPPNRGDSGRRIEVATIVQTPPTKAEYGIMTALIQEFPSDRKFNDLAYLTELEMNAQLAIEKTCIGSEEEKIALLRLRKIERDIAFYNLPQPEPQVSPVIAQLQNQMEELKSEVQKQFTIDPSILTVAKPKLAAVSLEPEGTICWHGPLQGTIAGKKSLRNFYIKSRNCLDLNLSDPATYEIMLVLNADFTAAEFSRPNIRHQQIRSAINTGRSFNPRNFKDSEEFLTKTEDYAGIGRIMQHAGDGRWWAWLKNGVTGQPFSHENLAQKYLDYVADRRKLPACAT